MQVKWTRKALLNLNEAIDYISTDKPMTAAEVGTKIWNAAKMLADHPGIGRPGRVAGTRELVISGLPFILPYAERNGAIFILRVLHTAMRWPERFKD
ncbi:MAG: type II toxin-antitoxin system RelE/ParE family toxin [Proteobacteria bacterium]|nr:type II toxin-antitoxin system RelE/ParE family toxin [Pseudomonadota bacterium]MBU1543973.1 type II toxin-antitoxin system RelE/ParE family toxin [Pseudomonadota bacterium]MBU2431608.1 type II toxin-antitoxin system RelE/ParE family toxin [Pseudomonadota bacterium]MBU2479948.1 type II toxin-antitoxin system RelE/ParE family toxin [Pseudomonadota bacterium]